MDEFYQAAVEDMKILVGLRASNEYNTIVILMERVARNLLKSVCKTLAINEADYRDSEMLRVIYRQIMDICKRQEYYLSEVDLSYLSEFRITAAYPSEEHISVTEDEKDYCASILDNIIEWLYDFRKGRGLSIDDLVNYISC